MSLASAGPGGVRAVADLARALRSELRSCALCPRRCSVDRLRGERGFCGAGTLALLASAGPHFGEEPELVGTGGSGAVFFGGCNLGCVYCQNADLSHGRAGREVPDEELAEEFLSLQRRGCHNVNLVTPSHHLPAIVSAYALALARGLTVPLVYNCGGYESVEVVRRLEGVVDVYMPDAKYADDAVARKYSAAPGYWDRCREALAEMWRQVGDLEVNADGVAVRGLLVRHLVLPNGLAGTRTVLEYLAGLSRDTYVNVMDQYRPCYRASAYPELARRSSRVEYLEALAVAAELRLTRGRSEG